LRSAISLTQAIGVIILISFLLIVTLKQASITAKHTEDSYAYQRAELFSQSAVEMAILAIHAHDRNTSGCLEHIHVSDDSFDANVTIKRYYLHKDDETYKNKDDWSNCASVVKKIETAQSNGMAWMEVTVVPKNSGKFLDKNITLVRTTLQRL
jgi:hypothetical protein